MHLHVLPFGGRGDAGLAQHKSSSHVASALAELWLRDREGSKPTDEGLFVSPEGVVREGATCNVFLLHGQTLSTPSLDSGLLAGVSRATVCSLAPSLGYEVEERTIGVEDLLSSDEAFVTSSTLHVAPVIALDEHAVSRGVPGPQVRRIQAAFQERVAAQIERWHAG